MKRKLLIALCAAAVLLFAAVSCAFADVAVNSVNFPDATFRRYVSENFDTDGNGSLSDSELEAVTEISIHSQFDSISSLKGIELFTNLTRLDCSADFLTELDVSRNTKLTYLKCTYCKLSELDLSNNRQLAELICPENHLTSLDLSNNNLLYSLSCHMNMLHELDISGTMVCSDRDRGVCYIGSQAMYITEDKNHHEIYTIGDNATVTMTTAQRQVFTSEWMGKSENERINIAMDESRIPEDPRFPDPFFLHYVYSFFDTDCDGTLSDSELAAVTKIDVWNMDISSLKGVELFTNLVYLDCVGCELTELDITGNTKLTYLNCGYNKLTRLDVSRNTKLIELHCPGNLLSSIDISKLPGLGILNVSNNNLTELDLSGNSQLYDIYCDGNRLTELDITRTQLMGSRSRYAWFGDQKINGMIAVIMTAAQKTAFDAEYYDAHTNDSVKIRMPDSRFLDQIFRRYVYDRFDTNGDGWLGDEEIAAVTEITVTDKGITSLQGVELFTNLTKLSCSGNEITDIDLSAMSELKYLSVYDNKLTVLDLSGNPQLYDIFCDENFLTELDISGTQILGSGTTECDLGNQKNGRTVTVTMTVTQKGVFDAEYAGSAANARVTADILLTDPRFPDPFFRDYVYDRFDIDGDGWLSVEELAAVTEISINYNYYDLYSLKGVELFVNLTSLKCNWNALTELDLSKNTKLTCLECSGNHLTVLDLSKNPLLRDICCDENYLTRLDISGTRMLSGNTNRCALGNQNTGGMLTVTMTAAQKSVFEAGFAAASASANVTVEIFDPLFPDPAFRAYVYEHFDTDGNGVLSDEEIDEVYQINVTGKGITSLKGVELFTNLRYLLCSSNELTELDVSRNTSLTELWCDSNRLSAINISMLPTLSILIVSSNSLTELDLSGNPLVSNLNCDDNCLTALDISGTQVYTGGTKRGDLGNQKNGGTVTVTMTLDQKSVFESGFAENTDNARVTLKLIDTRFPDPVFREYLINRFDRDDDNMLSDTEIAAVKEIDVYSKEIGSLKGIELFTNLNTLDCSDTEVTELDVRWNTKLIQLWCSGNMLSSIDISTLSELKQLSIFNNQLTELDLSGNPLLEELSCENNYLTDLDITGTRIYIGNTERGTLGNQKHNSTVTVTMTAAQKGVFDDQFARKTYNRGVTVNVKPGLELHTPAALTVIYEEAFEGTGFTEVYLSGSVTAIGANAFRNCAKLEYVQIPASVTSIADSAFDGCGSLIIAGEGGSAAESFANAHGIPFVALPE